MTNYLDIMCSMSGYTPKTDIWDELSDADNDKLEDVVQEIFKMVKNDYIKLTEFVMFLNWKCWEHYENGNIELSEKYSNLYYKYDNWVLDNLKDDELSYFLRTTD